MIVDKQVIPYPVFALYFMPGYRFNVHFKDGRSRGVFTFNGLTATVGSQTLASPNKSGVYPLEIENPETNEKATINIIVMVPVNKVDKNGFLNGYKLGKYPSTPLRGNKIYLPPNGFVEVNESNWQTRISPNFELGQFVSKQSSAYPKYLILRPNLLLKLEQILTALNQSGRRTEGFVIMSGYRTPWYNRNIGNTPYSRHLWGGASDIYIDENPEDGVMDDLNGDGEVNRLDAQWLARFIGNMSKQGKFGDRIGGLGIYGSNSAHGPFVHVDVRGARARW